MIKVGAAIAGGVAAAFGASLCCIGPLLAVFAGIGGAGLSVTFEPIRPYLLGASALLFVLGAVALYRPGDDAKCAGTGPCGAGRAGRVGRTATAFWAALGLAAILATFPWWSKLLV